MTRDDSLEQGRQLMAGSERSHLYLGVDLSPKVEGKKKASFSDLLGRKNDASSRKESRFQREPPKDQYSFADSSKYNYGTEPRKER